MNQLHRASCVVVAVAVGGCAITPQDFYANRASYSAEQVCRIWRVYDGEVSDAAAAEAARRGMSVERCRAILAEADSNNQAAAAGALLALALIAAAAKGGGSPSAPPSGATDTEWAWDQFMNEQNALVWACRGVQTGQFHPTVRCQFLPKIDSRWPGSRLY